MIKRLLAVAFIFACCLALAVLLACCSVAWMIRGGTATRRTETVVDGVPSDIGGGYVPC